MKRPFIENKITSNDDYIKCYCFLNLEFPPVAWAVNRGTLLSPLNVSKNTSNNIISFMYAGMLQSRNNKRLFNELVIEKYRSIYFPEKTSRLYGMYFFKSKEDALDRINDRNWPNYFNEDNLLEIRLFTPTEPTYVDANWITFAPLNKEKILDLSNLNWINKYWEGVAYNNEPVWEIISEGIAIIPDIEIRKKCREGLIELFPDCVIPITMAQIGGEIGSRGGTIFPYVRKIDENRINLTYLMNNEDFHEKEVIEKMLKHPAIGYLGELLLMNKSWLMPDFRPWFIDLELKYNFSYYDSRFSYSSMHIP